MKVSDYWYDLPKELIAQDPLDKRDQSRLLVVNKTTGEISHKHFYDVLDYINEGDVLVINDTKVIPARLIGTIDGKDAPCEIFLVKRIDKDLWECLVKPGKKLKIGTKVSFIKELSCEIVDIKDAKKEGDIIDSNSYMIKALVEESYGIGKRYDIVEDDYDKIKNQLLKSIKENDITIINAGSSAGTEDYTVHILRELGEVIVHGVSMKPGKPVILAIVDNKPVIGLPGYPLSAYLAFDLFVKPMLTYRIEDNGEIEAINSKRLVSSLKYREYVRVKVGKVEDKYISAPLNRGAASQMSMVRADGILIIPQNSGGVEASEVSKVKLLKSKSSLDKTLVSIGSPSL